MNFELNQLYHVYNQGNNRQKIFLVDDDYNTFLAYIVTLILPLVEMIAYCLMPNHFHFLIYTKENCSDYVTQGCVTIGILNNGIRKLLSGYCRIFNKRYDRSGSLFRQKTKAKEIGIGNRKHQQTYTCEEYCYNCFRYIHENPVEAGLVKLQSDWKWSSAAFYGGLESESICNMHLAKKYCGYNYETPMDNTITESWKKIIEEES